MSTNEPTPSTEMSSAVPAAGKPSRIAPDRSDVEWLPPSLTVEPPEPPGQGLAPYMHALRRHWLVSATFGTLGAIALAAVAWVFCVPEYTAEAFLQVHSTKQRVLFDTANPVTQFDIYKGTQQQLLKTPGFLARPLRREEVMALSIVSEQRDDLAWLQDELVVDFPGNSEIMRISMKGKDHKEIETLVNAVVQEYLDEAGGDERQNRSDRIDYLEDRHVEKANELRALRNHLRGLAVQSGTENPETLTLKQQNILQQFFVYRKEGAAVRFQRMRAEGELKVQQERYDRTRETFFPKEEDEISSAAKEVEMAIDREADLAMQSDRMGRALLLEKAELEDQLELADETAKPNVGERYRSRLQRELDTIDEQIAAWKAILRESFRYEKLALGREELSALEEDVITRTLEVEILKAHESELETAAEEIKTQAELLSGSSIDIEMTQGEIKLLEQLVGNIGEELQRAQFEQRAQIENQAQTRISLIGDGAISQDTNRNFRVALRAFAAVAGFFLPVIAIVWWDTRSRRINSLADVSQEIGLDVIGSVPIIPSRVARRLGDLPVRHQYWQTVLTESVDGIAARLLHQAEHEETRVILVTSAMENEGKTTIASQLALSLARTGRRTVLVDFDLRQPAIDGLFSLPNVPGVGDVLTQQSSAAEVVHSRDGDNLDIITAGQWDGRSVHVLTNGVTGSFLKELRSDYEFVVLDASPILPVADTRIISQHVDGVVLSIRRDVSQIPKVIAACEILQAFGVRTLGAVVIGTATDVYSRNSKYLADTTAER